MEDNNYVNQNYVFPKGSSSHDIFMQRTNCIVLLSNLKKWSANVRKNGRNINYFMKIIEEYAGTITEKLLRQIYLIMVLLNKRK